MIAEHNKIIISDFNGHFNRGDDEAVPQDHFLDSLNLKFRHRGFFTREGSSVDLIIGNPRRFSLYKKSDGSSRLLILDNAGRLYDSTNLFTPILTIAAMIDFSSVVLYDRAYITPHDREKGLTGQTVYVYDGVGTARPAAGAAPVGINFSAFVGVDTGNVEPGRHLFAVIYETASGYLTAPGPAIFAYYVAPAGFPGFTVSIHNIPIGPVGTVARHILATKVLINYNGDQNAQAYFFIPNGRIADNSTTIADFSFFDSELISSADYLFDNLSTIPAGVGIGTYKGSLITWGEFTLPAVVRVSKVGDPETMSASAGFLLANPGDAGGGVKNCIEFRGSLYICKSQRTMITQDNGGDPVSWTVTSVDASIGTECYGIGQILDYAGNTVDRFLLADRSGIRMFNGTFETDMTWKIFDIWKGINQTVFNRIQMSIDSVNKIIYCAIPYGTSTVPNLILYGDYTNGVDIQNGINIINANVGGLIKWSIWDMSVEPCSIIVDVDATTRKPIFRFAGEQGNIWKMDTTVDTDAGNSFITKAEFYLAYVGDGAGAVNNFKGIRLRARGAGNLRIRLSGEDRVLTSDPPPIVLTTLPGKELVREFNFTNERASIKLYQDQKHDRMDISRIIIFADEEYLERPA